MPISLCITVFVLLDQTFILMNNLNVTIRTLRALVFNVRQVAIIVARIVFRRPNS